MVAAILDMLYVATKLILLIAMKVYEIPVFQGKQQVAKLSDYFGEVEKQHGFSFPDEGEDYSSELSRGEGSGVQG
jgi:hypothetical protein